MSLLQPVKGTETQAFLGDYGAEPHGWFKLVNGILRGWRHAISGATYRVHLHEAIDFACPDGTPVKAVHDGTIIAQGTDSYDGARYLYLQVRVGLIFKLVFVYWHLQPGSFKYPKGAKVKAGATIALSGHSGNVTGPHLHVELWRVLRGTAVGMLYSAAARFDPRPFLNGAALSRIA